MQVVTLLISSLFNSAAWAMVVALLLSRWTWLEMRVNIGLVMYVVWIVLVLLCLWRVKKPFGIAFSLVNTAVCFVLTVFLSHGFTGAQMLPASLVREGFHQSQWAIGVVNTGLVAFSVACLVLIAALHIAMKSKGEHADEA